MSAQEALVRKIEKEEADVRRIGIDVRYICYSFTCKHHSHLFGKLLTIEEIREIYCIGVLPDDCRCAVSQVAVDKNGTPKHPGIEEKIKSYANRASKK